MKRKRCDEPDDWVSRRNRLSGSLSGYYRFVLAALCLFGIDNISLAFHVGRASPSTFGWKNNASCANESCNMNFVLSVKRAKKGSADVVGGVKKANAINHEDISRLHVNDKGFQTKSSQGKSNELIAYTQGTMDTALCLIPPDEAWDDIQRARHFARDPSFYTWPPAIRLFHPFVDRFELTEVATIIATAIEKYDLEAFDITIDQLLILPHFEALEHHEDSMKELPKQAKIEDKSISEEEERVQSLIAAEEEKGKKKLAKRKAKERGLKKSVTDLNAEKTMKSSSTKDQSPQQILKDQRKSLSEFNGPCILCLEPDENSKIHIQAFREILRKKLFDHYDPFSPSSAVTDAEILGRGLPNNTLKQHDLKKIDSHSVTNNNSTSHKRGKYSPSGKKKKAGSTFRPLITLGRFPTVSKAVTVAKKLQQVWEPLTFRVNDLHLVSKLDASTHVSNQSYPKHQNNTGLDLQHEDVPGSDPYSFKMDQNGNPILHENRELSLRKYHGSDSGDDTFSTKREYGCDAMIMLKGEEWHLLKKKDTQERVDFQNAANEELEEVNDSFHLAEEDEERIMELLLSPAALPGGQEGGIVNKSQKNNEEEEDDYLQHWLGEDDEVDEGATIIIGRTQFYMGEMRQYTGMPASSTMDGKDRALGKVSGAARRRGAVHRQGDRWREGDYGQKEKDYLP